MRIARRPNVFIRDNRYIRNRFFSASFAASVVKKIGVFIYFAHFSQLIVILKLFFIYATNQKEKPVSNFPRRACLTVFFVKNVFFRTPSIRNAFIKTSFRRPAPRFLSTSAQKSRRALAQIPDLGKINGTELADGGFKRSNLPFEAAATRRNAVRLFPPKLYPQRQHNAARSVLCKKSTS